jgi:hypothetical protein
MKFKNLVLVFITCASASIYAEEFEYDFKGAHCNFIEEHDSSLAKAYAASIIPGAIIGGIGGALCSLAEKEHADLWPLFWLAEICEREALVEIISTDLASNTVYHHKRLMELSAWIASWAVYLSMNE